MAGETVAAHPACLLVESLCANEPKPLHVFLCPACLFLNYASKGLGHKRRVRAVERYGDPATVSMIIALVATSAPALPKEKSIRNERTNDLACGESPHLRKVDRHFE